MYIFESEIGDMIPSADGKNSESYLRVENEWF